MWNPHASISIIWVGSNRCANQKFPLGWLVCWCHWMTPMWSWLSSIVEIQNQSRSILSQLRYFNLRGVILSDSFISMLKLVRDSKDLIKHQNSKMYFDENLLGTYLLKVFYDMTCDRYIEILVNAREWLYMLFILKWDREIICWIGRIWSNNLLTQIVIKIYYHETKSIS